MTDSNPSHPPKTLRAFFWGMLTLALQGVGGIQVIAHREIVEKNRWLTHQEFLEEWAVAQVIPGPSVINLCLLLGFRWFGFRGALTALAGLVLLPLVLILLLAFFYSRHQDLAALSGALRGMGAVASGLIMASALKLTSTYLTNPMGVKTSVALTTIAFVVTAFLNWPLYIAILCWGSLGIMLAYRRLA
jgi:chromate transporter